MKVQRLSEKLGAEITDVDLSAGKFDADFDHILKAFRDDHVVACRSQNIDEDDFLAFAQKFGEIEGHVSERPDGTPYTPVHTISNFDASGNPSETPYIDRNFYWHSDKSYYPKPSLLTMLQGLELPPKGGDTEFADMTAAYEALPSGTKKKIADLKVVHSRQYQFESISGRSPSEAELNKAPPVIHPMVRTHPDTGRKSLYIGSPCSEIIGMPTEEARKLLQELLLHSTSDGFRYAHQWRVNDVVFWDNRCLMHRATRNFEMKSHRRVLRRVAVKGSAPV